MKTLLILMALAIASPAWAISDSILFYCSQTKNPDACVNMFAQEQQAQRAFIERQMEHQMALAEEQSRGMALFGSGFGLINGMNQGFNNMRVSPPPPVQFQPVPMPFPFAGSR